MNASLAIVAVGNAAPVWLGRDGVVLTPVRLPASYGSQLGDDWWGTMGRDRGRGDAVTGRFASDLTGNAGLLRTSATPGFAIRDDLAMAAYLFCRTLGASDGGLLNYYA